MSNGQPDPHGETLDAMEATPLLRMLDNALYPIRIAAFEALTRLPLATASWRVIARYASWALEESGAEPERLAVVDGIPWIPVRSTRQLVARLASEGEGEVAVRAARALATIAAPNSPDGERESSDVESEGTQLHPSWLRAAAPGFSSASTAEREAAAALLAESGLPASIGSTWIRETQYRLLRQQHVLDQIEQRGLAGAAVVELFERSDLDFDIGLGNDTAYWVWQMQGSFQPHLEGLFGLYKRCAERIWAQWRNYQPGDELFPMFFSSDLEIGERWLCWQIGWTVSRGGLQGLVPALAEHLAAGDDDERLAAAALIADAADYATQASAPVFGGGLGPDRGRPTVELITEEVGGEPKSSPGTPLDDDVQFTVYRPRRVRPERWYSVIAFIHKTTPVEIVPGAGVVDPVEVVDQQAKTLLREEGASFARVVGDSSISLSKGTELLFEPWLDGVEFNPLLVWVRWEEPVHHARFRFAVPAQLDGRRLSGGLRVFVGVMLIGEVTFQIEVDSTMDDDMSPEQVPIKRYRKIFASYSHRDADIVRAVAAFGQLIGDEYYIDAFTLRSGERWEPRLTELIDAADVFQLFWSSNAMTSEPVLHEIEHALGLERDGFIRPIRWEEPLPRDERRGIPPKAILDLHFSWLPRHDAPSQRPTESQPESELPPPMPPISEPDISFDSEPTVAPPGYPPSDYPSSGYAPSPSPSPVETAPPRGGGTLTRTFGTAVSGLGVVLCLIALVLPAQLSAPSDPGTPTTIPVALFVTGVVLTAIGVAILAIRRARRRRGRS